MVVDGFGTYWGSECFSWGFRAGPPAMDSVVCGNDTRRLAVRPGAASPRPNRFPSQWRPTNRDLGAVGTSRHHAHHDRGTNGSAAYGAGPGLSDPRGHCDRGGQLRACRRSGVVCEPASRSARKDRRRWPGSTCRGRGACGSAAQGSLAAVSGDLPWWNRVRHTRGRPHHRRVPVADQGFLRRPYLPRESVNAEGPGQTARGRRASEGDRRETTRDRTTSGHQPRSGGGQMTSHHRWRW